MTSHVGHGDQLNLSDTAKELLARAAELRPLLERNAARGEEDRRIADENIDALADAGLFKITVPRRFGGHEVDIRTKTRGLRRLAEACGSTAWVLALTNVCTWLVGLYPTRPSRTSSAPTPTRASRRARAVAPTSARRSTAAAWSADGGRGRRARCTRRGASSACSDRTEAGRGHRARARAHADERADDRGHLVRRRHEGHRAATRSWPRSVFVPEHRYCRCPRRSRTSTRPSTPTRRSTARRSSPCGAHPRRPAARSRPRGAEDLAIEKAPKRAVSYTRLATQAESTAFQLKVAEAAMTLDDGAAARVPGGRRHRPLGGERREDRLPQPRAGAGGHGLHGRHRVARRSPPHLDAHGASGFADSSPMQRIWRDCEHRRAPRRGQPARQPRGLRQGAARTSRATSPSWSEQPKGRQR